MLSRLIDSSVIVLENIFRFMEEGASPERAAGEGGSEVALPVLAATVTTSVVFFPVFLLDGVSKYLFTDLAYGVFSRSLPHMPFSMTLIPLFCAKFVQGKSEDRIKADDRADHGKAALQRGKDTRTSLFQRGVDAFNRGFVTMLERYEKLAYHWIAKPWLTAGVILAGIVVALAVSLPFLGRAYFPTADPGQFVITVKMPSGTRLEVSNRYIARVEQVVRQTVASSELGIIVSNIGISTDISAIYTPNSAMDTAFVQVALTENHKISSFAYIDRTRAALARQTPELRTYFQTGGTIDSVINQGLPAPLDIQISSNDEAAAFAQAQQLAESLRRLPTVAGVYVPQDLRYPGLALNIDRERASLIGLTPKNVVDNVIIALTSDSTISPSYWVDPKTGNNYFLSVQYSNKQIGSMNMEDLESIPLRGDNVKGYTPLRSVAFLKPIDTPTEVDHYQLRRVMDVYVQPKTESLTAVDKQVDRLMTRIPTSHGMKTSLHGAPVNMNTAFERFGLGLILAVALVYLILMAQFTSFIDPLIILMAVPPGLAGVSVMLVITGSTLNIMSLMGVIMMTGIVVSNSILIVEFAAILHEQGKSRFDAVVQSCKIRLRPILMTSLATLLGLIPLALGLEAGSQQYAPLARAIIGGLLASVVLTVFLVPAVYMIIHGREKESSAAAQPQETR